LQLYAEVLEIGGEKKDPMEIGRDGERVKMEYLVIFVGLIVGSFDWTGTQ
jgi:hypothetical protein